MDLQVQKTKEVFQQQLLVIQAYQVLEMPILEVNQEVIHEDQEVNVVVVDLYWLLWLLLHQRLKSMLLMNLWVNQVSQQAPKSVVAGVVHRVL